MHDFQLENPARFETAIHRFDSENARDPNLEQTENGRQPRELVYARWLTDWVLRLRPNASEALRLAARCQHLCRWTIPRSAFPPTRAGYLQWRSELKLFHARKAGEILRELGYGENLVLRVQALNMKENFPQDPECRTLEDALCLVFLERQLANFADKSGEQKVIVALQKSWGKMTSTAHAEALKLSLGSRERALLERALRSE